MKQVVPVVIASVLWVGCVGLAAEPVRIYLANDDHTDYMWTADAETYNAAFVDLLDYYLRPRTMPTGPTTGRRRFTFAISRRGWRCRTSL